MSTVPAEAKILCRREIVAMRRSTLGSRPSRKPKKKSSENIRSLRACLSCRRSARQCLTSEGETAKTDTDFGGLAAGEIGDEIAGFDCGQRLPEPFPERGLEHAHVFPAFDERIASRVKHDVINLGSRFGEE